MADRHKEWLDTPTECGLHPMLEDEHLQKP